jgi:DNA-binding beta-propeller fold protein YncE/mono/diheme cytochrome c family protein
MLLCVGIAASAATTRAGVGGPGWFAPCAIAIGAHGRRLYVAGEPARQVAVLDLDRRRVVERFGLGATPTGLALMGSELAVTCSDGACNEVLLLDRQTGAITRRLPAGDGVCAPMAANNERGLYVCNRFEATAALLDPNSGQRLASGEVPREPVAESLSRDGCVLAVANLLPAGPADGILARAAVSLLDARTLKALVNVPLPNGSKSVRGLAFEPSGDLCAVVHDVGRFQIPATQVEFGWMNVSALSLVSASERRLRATLLLDDARRGAANPWAVAWTPDGRLLLVTHGGTHELSIIDAGALRRKLPGVPAGTLVTDFGFLQGIRTRITLPGDGPRALAVSHGKAYIAQFFSDSIAVVDLRSRRCVGEIPLTVAGAHWGLRTKRGAMNCADESRPEAKAAEGCRSPRRYGVVRGAAGDLEREGERLFNDATLCHQGWQSCASCHPDGRADGLNWDLLNDGLGNPKNTKSLLLASKTPPEMSLGVRATFDGAVRAGLRHILYTEPRPEAVKAIEAYLRSLKPQPSPRLVNGKLSKAAQRGKRVFMRAGCADCHTPPLFTDRRRHDVGTRRSFDKPNDLFYTPTLIECWRSAPYLHDGSAATIRDVLTARNPHDKHGRTSDLSARQLNDLVEYVISL